MPVENLTQLFGFDARYVVYPVAALVIAGVAKFLIHRFLQNWAKKTEGKIDDEIVSYLNSLVTPLLLISILYCISTWLPLAAKYIAYAQKAFIIIAILLIALYSSRLVSSILTILQSQKPNLQRFLHPLKLLSNILFVLLAIALSLKTLHVNLTDEGIRLVRIIGIVVGAYVLLKIINLAVAHMESDDKIRVLFQHDQIPLVSRRSPEFAPLGRELSHFQSKLPAN